MENGKQNKNGKVTIEKLAQMTQGEFSRMDARFDKVDMTLKTILDVVLEIPSKKAFERLENKVENIDLRLTSVERKVK